MYFLRRKDGERRWGHGPVLANRRHDIRLDEKVGSLMFIRVSDHIVYIEVHDGLFLTRVDVTYVTVALIHASEYAEPVQSSMRLRCPLRFPE